MRFIVPFRPSPALVVASLALLVSLAGTGVAAVALAPKNSVGSEQVIDGSLRSSDFQAGQVLAGSEVFSRSVDGPVAPRSADTLSTIASLAIPKPGAYVIWARAQIDSANLGGQCKLLAHGVPNSGGATPDAAAVSSIVEGSVGGPSPTLWTTLVHGFGSGGGTVDLQCGSMSRGTPPVRKIRITAVRLGGETG